MNLIKNIIARYLFNYRLKNQLLDYVILRKLDLNGDSKKLFSKNLPRENKDCPSIAFIIPGMLKGSGGHTSILRLGTYLTELGHQVAYISYKPQNKTEMTSNAKSNLAGFKGEVLGPDALSKYNYDIGIATFWLSAYYLWNASNCNYKAYFIQDYEPDFYPSGDVSSFVKMTYRMGYHMISLGPWNKNRIEKEIGVNVDEIIFPYEPGEYKYESGWESKFETKKTFNVCVYLKRTEKRGPVLLLMGLEELYKTARARGFKLQISFFGDDKKLRYPICIPYRNLGKLGKKELKKLYCESDFGIVFSYTNISLIPFEMMACRCPVVEVNDGSFSSFFDPECAILVNSNPQDFVKKIMYYIEYPEERKKVTEVAIRSIEQKTWREAVNQFRQIIVDGYNGFEPKQD